MVLQALEGLSDRDAIRQLRNRIDWKVACGLALDDAGFDFTNLTLWRVKPRSSNRPNRMFDAVLVNDALLMAARSRATSPETILHSDHGSGFISWSFTQNLKNHELLGSMGTIGDCFDNAPMESFWGSMQIELLNRKKWMTYVELATAIADYIVNFYNSSRRHSSLDYLTPDEFEALRSLDSPARTLITVGQ